MEEVYCIGVTGVSFEAAHVTRTNHRDYGLHGHTYSIDAEVCIRGRLGEYDMVFDVTVLKRYLEEIARSFDHKLLIGKKQLDETSKIVRVESTRIVILEDVSQATMESLAKSIARLLHGYLTKEIRVEQGAWLIVRVWQGRNEYATYKIGI